MISQHKKNEIANALKALNERNDILRREAVERLGEIGISHPKVIELLQDVVINDSSKSVRLAAQKSLDFLQENPTDNLQSASCQQQTGISDLETESIILELLRQQNKTLESIRELIFNSLVREKNSEKTYQVRSRVVEIDVSISSLIDLSFRWFIASIPLGIVVGIVVALLNSCRY